MGREKKKVCSKCGIEKSVDEFGIKAKNRDGYSNLCKNCHNEQSKNYFKTHKEQKREYDKKYYYIHKEQRREYKKQYCEKNKEKIKERKRIYRQNNIEYFRKCDRDRYQVDKENKKEMAKRYYRFHIEERKEYRKEYCQINREKVRKASNNYHKIRSKRDPSFRLRRIVSVVIRTALKKSGSNKDRTVLYYLPYSIGQLKQHLESQFEPWMNWNNHGNFKLRGKRVWHIDHIIPQSSFPYDSMEHPNFQKAWALENLRPLEAIENIKKSNKIIGEQNEEKSYS